MVLRYLPLVYVKNVILLFGLDLNSRFLILCKRILNKNNLSVSAGSTAEGVL